MAKVDDTIAAGEIAAREQLSIDAGLAEWVYHRAVTDQGLSLGDISSTLNTVTFEQKVLAQYGFRLGSDGFIYNIADGFTAAVVQEQTTKNYTIVYRGTDAGDAGDANNADARDRDQDSLLGGPGTLAPNQATDAINLADAVLALATAQGRDVHVVGQSLGGGLAALVAAARGVSASLFAPAPFTPQLSPLAIQNALALDQLTIPDLATANYTISVSLTSGGRTVGDAVKRLYDEPTYERFLNTYNSLIAQYGININSDRVAVYRNQGEILTTDLAYRYLPQFKDANEPAYDFGSSLASGASGWLHTQALNALEVRSKHDPNSPFEFAALSRNDSILRDALIGDSVGVLGPLGQARSDDPTIATSSRVGPYGPDPGIVERAVEDDRRRQRIVRLFRARIRSDEWHSRNRGSRSGIGGRCRRRPSRIDGALWDRTSRARGLAKRRRRHIDDR